MIQKKWFCVETAADGSVLSCTQVEAKGRSGAVVRFYEAVDEADACSQAKEWYDRWREGRRIANSRWRIKRAAAGLCISQQAGCDKTARPGMRTCQSCSDRTAAAQRRRRERRELGDFRDLRLNPGGAVAVMNTRSENRRRSRRNAASLAGSSYGYFHLLILRKLDELSPGEALAFRAWLVSKIPSMQQTRSEWHPPLVESVADAAE